MGIYIYIYMYQYLDERPLGCHTAIIARTIKKMSSEHLLYNPMRRRFSVKLYPLRL